MGDVVTLGHGSDSIAARTPEGTAPNKPLHLTAGLAPYGRPGRRR